LLDTHGEVIGVDTALYNPDEKGGFIGIGFAIPADSAAWMSVNDPFCGLPVLRNFYQRSAAPA
jgi:S1-C subfamily serine protease